MSKPGADGERPGILSREADEFGGGVTCQEPGDPLVGVPQLPRSSRLLLAALVLVSAAGLTAALGQVQQRARGR